MHFVYTELTLVLFGSQYFCWSLIHWLLYVFFFVKNIKKKRWQQNWITNLYVKRGTNLKASNQDRICVVRIMVLLWLNWNTLTSVNKDLFYGKNNFIFIGLMDIYWIVETNQRFLSCDRVDNSHYQSHQTTVTHYYKCWYLCTCNVKTSLKIIAIDMFIIIREKNEARLTSISTIFIMDSAVIIHSFIRSANDYS